MEREDEFNLNDDYMWYHNYDGYYFMDLYDGSLIGSGKRCSDKQGCGSVKAGDRMGLLVKAGAEGYVRFYRNGTAFGPGFSGPVKAPLVLVVQMTYRGESLELLPGAVAPVTTHTIAPVIHDLSSSTDEGSSSAPPTRGTKRKHVDDATRVKQDIMKVLECPCCMEVRSDMVLCSGDNQHLVCIPCLDRLKKPKKCPQCNIPIRGKRMTVPTRIFKNIIDICEPSVACPNSHNGCMFTCARDHMAAHARVCDKRAFGCALECDNNCPWRGTVDQYPEHLRSAHGNKLFDGRQAPTLGLMLKRLDKAPRQQLTTSFMMKPDHAQHTEYFRRGGQLFSVFMLPLPGTDRILFAVQAFVTPEASKMMNYTLTVKVLGSRQTPLTYTAKCASAMYCRDRIEPPFAVYLSKDDFLLTDIQMTVVLHYLKK
jgi:hypothetical protein